MARGQALQVTQAIGARQSAVFDFQPHVFIERFGLLLREFAVAPWSELPFLMPSGHLSDDSGFPSERFVGGPAGPS